ncbi:MAG: DNA helicase RecQ [Candidatus Sumerlaeia bacterium]
MDRLPHILKKFWGYEQFRPNQREAMECVIGGRDSLVVLPTGGGKSICYQAPAMALPGMAVVVSPLISLMKDQIDGLVACGVPAASLNSSISFEERRAVFGAMHGGRLKILYVAPERLLMDGFLDHLRDVNVSFFAIDEAHCISQWGHDFRPEYRRLIALKENFPGAAVHAYTATATPIVRDDIARQLGMGGHETIVGSFHRPNLIYSVERRVKRLGQVAEVCERYRGESGIVYCLTRKNVEKLADELVHEGFSAAPYHAGLDDAVRRGNQDDFTNDRVQIIVATVAFGMGIDKSNVRFVVHSGMPRSLEHYQQESGRAGRDGLDSECVLLYSGQDYGFWRTMLEEMEPEARRIAQGKLGAMYEYCETPRCRHAALLEYFGETLRVHPCGSCDVCLGRLEPVPDSLLISQKILSSVVRQGEGFGPMHTAMVVTGSQDEAVLAAGHDSLSTYGLLNDIERETALDWIGQLSAQQYMERLDATGLKVTDKGWLVLRGEVTPRLMREATVKPRERRSPDRPPEPDVVLARPRRPRTDDAQWDGVDRDLFDMLKVLRRGMAEAHELRPYLIFSDATLRDMARRRPSNKKSLLQVSGVGQYKAAEYGKDFLKLIKDYCAAHDLLTDQE